MARTARAVLEATTCVVDGGWGNYRQYHAVFSFYAANRACRVFVARDREDRVAGTSVATRYRRTGWIGHVFVRPDARGHGLGTRLTSIAIKHLQRAGCETVLLASTELGRPIYDRLGFQVEGAYHELRGEALPRGVDPRPYRPLLPSDSTALTVFDRRVTGDDRAAIVTGFLGFAWGAFAGDHLVGAVLPLPWGGVAAALLPGAGRPEIDATVSLIRSVGSTGAEVMVYPHSENRLALDMLRDQGFAELRTVPRMVLGKPSDWMPSALWNPLSLGLG